MRAPRLLLVALLASSVLAGCAAGPGAVTEPAPPPPAPPVVEAEGATVTYAGDAALVTWQGNLTPPGRTSAGVASVGQPRSPLDPPAFADHAFTLPPEVTLVTGWLNWSDGKARLGFRVLNETGRSWCGAPSGQGTSLECFATLFARREAPLDWKARVSALSRDGEAAPVGYQLTLMLRAAPLPLLGPPAPAGEGAPLRFAPPVLVDAGRRTAEPSIALTPKGTVYVAAPTGAQESLWRSTDGGRTFAFVPIHGAPTDPLSAYPVGGGDSDVAVVGEDVVYFADQQGAQGQTVSSSRDGGKTWFTQPFASGVTRLADRQWLVTDGPLDVWLAFNGAASGTGADFRATVARSLDGGRTWPLKTTIEGDSCFRGSFARSPDGTLYLAGCDTEGPGVAVSTDDGLTWTWRNVALRKGETTTSFRFPAHLFVVATVDAAGNAYVVWSDEAQNPEDTGAPPGPVQGLNVWMAASTDKGQTWSMPKKVNGAPGTYVMPWATAGAEGKLAVAYYGTRFAGHPERVLGEWYLVVAVTEDALADAPRWHEAVAAPEPVQYGPVCMRGSACGHARNLLDFFQIQADAEGRVHAAYVDGRAGGTARDSLVMYVRQDGGPTLGGPSVDKNGGNTGSGPLPPIR